MKNILGDYDTKMVFTNVPDLPTDVNSLSITLRPADLIPTKVSKLGIKSRKMFVPTLYGNTNQGYSMVPYRNKEADYCSINSKPSYSKWYNPLEDDKDKIIYISVQPQSYTILV